jgi:predicted lipoprotein with Yx(FWY)xxD motif
VKSRFALTLAATALAAVALVGCSSPAPTPSPTAEKPSPAASAPATTVSLDANVAASSLGQIVVDSQGLTAYYFDKDAANSGVSACTGGCAQAWPAIMSKTATPAVTGITGTVATIPSGNGFQITINGRPIYTYQGDKAAGDVTGQGVGNVWYVIAPTGDEIKG